MTSLIWFLFLFKSRFPFSHMLPLFQATLFWEKLLLHTFSEQLLRYNSYLFGAAISSEQLFFPFCQDIHLFARVIFSEQFLFRCETSTEQPLPENRIELRIHFATVIFFRETVQGKDIYKGATVLKQILLHSINFFRKVTFWKNLIFQKSNVPHYLLFLESRAFRARNFSKDATFYSNYVFRRATFLQHTF